MTELTDEELLYASDEDRAFYNEITKGLPTRAGKNGNYLDKFGVEIPFHSEAHILRHFRDAIEIVKPRSILEIGFNMGHSCAMWLNLCDAFVVSCDVSYKDETLDAGKVLWKQYAGRFIYLNREHETFKQIWRQKFDLIFIDGTHDENNITTDIQLAKDLKIPYLLFDDWYPRYGETQKAVAKFPELQLVKDMNNLRLYKFNF